MPNTNQTQAQTEKFLGKISNNLITVFEHPRFDQFKELLHCAFDIALCNRLMDDHKDRTDLLFIKNSYLALVQNMKNHGEEVVTDAFNHYLPSINFNLPKKVNSK